MPSQGAGRRIGLGLRRTGRGSCIVFTVGATPVFWLNELCCVGHGPLYAWWDEL
jgi:hypothetical protein